MDLLPRGGKLPKIGSPKLKPGDGSKPGAGAASGGAIGAEGGTIGVSSSTTKSYAQMLDDGPKYTGELDTAITQNTADKVITGPGILDRYHVRIFNAEPAAIELRPYIQGDAKADTFVRYRLMNKNDADGNVIPPEKLEEEANVFTQISVSKERGTIVNEYSYASKDTLKATGGEMRFSDQCFQAWEKEGGGDGLNTLIQFKVENKAAKDAMVKGHRDKKVPLSRPQTWGPGDDTYRAITGSDNGRPYIYMLKDHHTALGNKKVTEIQTIPEPNAIIVFKLAPA